MKLYHGRPYPIPHKHKTVLMKEIKPLCNIYIESVGVATIIKMGITDIYHTQKG
jgi:hypothetical protein